MFFAGDTAETGVLLPETSGKACCSDTIKKQIEQNEPTRRGVLYHAVYGIAVQPLAPYTIALRLGLTGRPLQILESSFLLPK
ncbi:MAG: hypothetical protein ICV53_14180 [Flavisolibacter sp.]|nr:hypothetical protein [Flavisolibacter sp.]